MKTYTSVLAQIERLQQEAETLKAREREGVVSRIREAISVYGLEEEELFGPVKLKRKKAPVPEVDKNGKPIKPRIGGKSRWPDALFVAVAERAKRHMDSTNATLGDALFVAQDEFVPPNLHLTQASLGSYTQHSKALRTALEAAGVEYPS